jgi:hypothetical protein
MLADLAEKYEKASRLREEPVLPPTEMELQAVWFEQLCQPSLRTTEGETLHIIQPGFWNHGAGPDFQQAALRLADGSLLRGSVEVHLRAEDWERHGHGADPNYEETILHLVWDKPARPFFPATARFRKVRQVILADQLLASWPEIHRALPATGASMAPGATLPLAHPGACAVILREWPTERVLELLRAAGLYRLRRKGERLRWREKVIGPEQLLWELLAEALGYSANKAPFRLLAQRVRYQTPELIHEPSRQALLYGVANFLPAESWRTLSSDARAVLRPLWDEWWKLRENWGELVLPRAWWELANLRPANRPERRLAALASLYSFIPELSRAWLAGEAPLFERFLTQARDPFWEEHATFRSVRQARSLPLLGSDRIGDMLLNIFWPRLLVTSPVTAEAGLKKVSAPATSPAKIAYQRIIPQVKLGGQAAEALVQQGLLQLYADYCLTDATNCALCPFPEVAQKFAAK